MQVSIEINDFPSILLASLFVVSMVLFVVLQFHSNKLKVAWDMFKKSGEWKTPTIWNILEHSEFKRNLKFNRKPSFFEKSPKNEVTKPILKKIKIYLLLTLLSLGSAFTLLILYYL